MERWRVERVTANQVPVECFQVTEVEDHPVAFCDGALVEIPGLDQAQQRIGILAGLLECVSCVGLGPHNTALTVYKKRQRRGCNLSPMNLAGAAASLRKSSSALNPLGGRHGRYVTLPRELVTPLECRRRLCRAL